MRCPLISLLLACSLTLAFTGACSCQKDPEPVVEPAPGPEPDPEPDPGFLEEVIPGIYDAQGGNRLYDSASQQLSRLVSGGRVSMRILEPGTLRVLSVSSWPENLHEGDRVQLFCRETERGITRFSKQYADVRVLKVKDGLVWLESPEGVRFIVVP